MRDMERDVSWATRTKITEVFQLGMGKRPYQHQLEGVISFLNAIKDGRQRRFLHFYAPRTGKTCIQAALSYILLRRELCFRMVIVVNDRGCLDSQSFDAVCSFIKNLQEAPEVAQADSSSDIGDWLQRCRRDVHKRVVLFTTLQKFNANDETSCEVSASAALAAATLVMPDEAHRSHKVWGKSARGGSRTQYEPCGLGAVWNSVPFGDEFGMNSA